MVGRCNRQRRNMKMNQTLLKRVIPEVLALGGLVVLTGVLAVAQAPASDSSAAPVAAQSTDQRTDGQIEMDVVHALDASKALKSDLITAATIEGEVTLSGTVSSDASSELAESIASRVAGVTKVNNNLKIGDPQAAAQAPKNTDPGAQQMADSQGDVSMEPVAPPPANDGQAPGSPQAQDPYPSARPQYAPQPPYVPANPRIYRTQPQAQ